MLGAPAAIQRMEDEDLIPAVAPDANTWEPETVTEVDDNGEFVLVVPHETAKFRLVVDAIYAHYSEVEWFVPNELGQAVELQLTLDPAGAVQGTLVNDSGLPAAGGRIRLAPEDCPGKAKEASVSPTGAFIVRGLVPGLYKCAAVSPGLAAGVLPGIHVSPGTTTIVRVGLPEECTLRGLVMNELGQPLEGVHVSLGSSPNPLDDAISGLQHMRAITTKDGVFRIGSLGVGQYTIVARKNGLRTSRLEGIVVDLNHASPLVNITMGAGNSATGRVLQADRRPKRGLLVKVFEGLTGGEEPLTFQAAYTDAEGSFHVSGIGDGPYATVVRLEDKEEVVFRGASYGIESEDFVLPPRTVVQGHVVDGSYGSPIPRFKATVVPLMAGPDGQVSPGGPREDWFAEKTGTFALGFHEESVVGFVLVVEARGFAPERLTGVIDFAGQRRAGLDVRLRRE
jgi:carboxypeptidase family protein